MAGDVLKLCINIFNLLVFLKDFICLINAWNMEHIKLLKLWLT